MQKINVKLIPISYDSKIGDSCLKFKLKGDNINYVVANTLRRVIFNDIPIFAFDEFKFEKNTSVFHNNYMICRIKNMPIWGVENKHDILIHNKENVLDEENNNPDSDLDDIVETEENVKLVNLKQMAPMTMYVNYKNKTTENINVTTDDAKFYYNGKLIKSPYPTSIPIVGLQPGQEISFSAITKLGTEEIYASFSACNIASFSYDKNDNEIEFNLESSGQITEKRILLVSVFNIIKKLEHFLKLFKESEQSNSHLSGTISVNDEDHTMGNLITKGMQQHKDIDFAGYNMPHPLLRKIIIDYKLKKNTISNIINDVVKYYIELFEYLNKLFKTL